MKFKSLILATLGLATSLSAKAGDFFTASIPEEKVKDISATDLGYLQNLKSKGKLIETKKGNKIEIVFEENEFGSLYKSLMEMGLVVNKVSSDSQKTGGGTGSVERTSK